MPQGGTLRCWGPKTLAWGFAMAPHRLRVLVNNLRQEMMQSISQLYEPALNVLLYGVMDLSNETNKQLLIIIQDYIIRT